MNAAATPAPTVAAGSHAAWKTPFTPSPGSSTPGPAVDPAEGTGELMGFFYLSLACSAIIAVVGVVTWYLLR